MQSENLAAACQEPAAGAGSKQFSMGLSAWLALGAWLLFTAVLTALYLQVPPSPDHAVYDYIGWVVNRGGTLYVDAADQNWPGQMLIHTLSVALFGAELWSYRLFELLVIIPLSCFVLFAFLRSVGDTLAALLVIPIYQGMYVTSGFWIAGQRELVAAPLLIAAAHCLWRRVHGARRRTLILEGILISASTLIRPTLLIMAPFLTLADVLQKSRTGRSWKTILADHALVALCIIIPIGLLALAAAPSGALAAWYDVSVRFNLEVYSGSMRPWDMTMAVAPLLLQSWHWYLLWSAVGAVLLWRRDSVALSFAAMVLPTTLVSFFVQGKGLGYHLGPLLPLMALLIACTVAAGARALARRDRGPVATVLAALALLLPAAGLAKKVWGDLAAPRQALLGQISKKEMYARYELDEGGWTVRDMVELAEHINATTPEDATVLFWERPCHVYTLTQRRSPLFAAAFTFLEEPTPEFSLFSRWKAEIEEVMTERPPAVLLLVRDEQLGGYRALPAERGEKPRLADVIRNHLPEYELETSVGLVDLYRRTDASGLTERVN